MGIVIISILICSFIYFLFSEFVSNRQKETASYADKAVVLTDEGIPRSDIPLAKKNQEHDDAPKTTPAFAQVQPQGSLEVINEDVVNEEMERRGLSVSNSTSVPPRGISAQAKTPHPLHSIPLSDNEDLKYTAVPKGNPSYSPYFHLLNKKLEPRINDLVQQLLPWIPEKRCIACGEPAEGKNGVRLSNGMFVHQSCHAELIIMLRIINSDADIPSSASKHYEFLLRLIIINQFWPTYPHDWEQRKYAVMLRDEYACDECGEENLPLHIHHVTPISVGGNHLLGNLQCLCEDCHNDAHDGHLSNTQHKGKNRTIIDIAFNKGRNLKIRYKDVGGRYSERTIQPLHYMVSPQGASALRAYCFLRKSERTFIIRKMSKVQVIY